MRDLELETSGKHQRRNQIDREKGADSGGNRYEAGFNQSGSHRHRDRSYLQEFHRLPDRSRSQESRQYRDCSHSCEHVDQGLDSSRE